MLHPDTEVRLGRFGLGVFVTAPIPKGTVTWVRDSLDQVFTDGDVSKMTPGERNILLKWSYVNEAGERILQWGNAIFHNHSCSPTTVSTEFMGGDIDLAARDLLPGDELTNDYRTFYNPRSDPMMDFMCHCGEDDCCRDLGSAPLPFVSERLDRLSLEAHKLMRSVPQPVLDCLGL